MNFAYSSIISTEPGTREFILIRRPEISFTVGGTNRSMSYFGLVDTGADYTIFPKSVADFVGIRLERAAGPAAIVFGGHRVELLTGEAILSVESDGELITWKNEVSFFDFPSADEETVVLGNAGFLEYFTAVFDGQECTLALFPNDDLPGT